MTHSQHVIRETLFADCICLDHAHVMLMKKQQCLSKLQPTNSRGGDKLSAYSCIYVHFINWHYLLDVNIRCALTTNRWPSRTTMIFHKPDKSETWIAAMKYGFIGIFINPCIVNPTLSASYIRLYYDADIHHGSGDSDFASHCWFTTHLS